MKLLSQDYHVKLTHLTSALHCANNLEWKDFMTKWLKIPENKKLSKAGDDRMPGFTWCGSIYMDTIHHQVAWPSDCIMSTIREGAGRVTLKGKETYKKVSQSTIQVNELFWPMRNGAGELISSLPIEKLAADLEMDYEKHEAVAKSLGFRLFVKPASVNRSKHNRVRACFDQWSCEGTVTVQDQELISENVLRDIFEQAGLRCGLGDWRPNAPLKPGPYGKFAVELTSM